MPTGRQLLSLPTIYWHSTPATSRSCAHPIHLPNSHSGHPHTRNHAHNGLLLLQRVSLSLSLSLSPQQTALTTSSFSTSTKHIDWTQRRAKFWDCDFPYLSLFVTEPRERRGLRLLVDSCVAAQGRSDGRARSSALRAKTSFVSGAPSPTATKKYFEPLAPPAPLVQSKWLWSWPTQHHRVSTWSLMRTRKS